MSEDRLERALHEMRAEDVDAGTIETARERVWEKAIAAIELHTGHEIGALPADRFRRLMAEEIDLRGFKLRSSDSPPARGRASRA